MLFDKTKSAVDKAPDTRAGAKSSPTVRVVTRRVAKPATHRKLPIGYRYERIRGSKIRSCITKKKISRSRPMKLASNKKALTSGFMRNKSITRTAKVPYRFILGCRFMRSIT